MRPEAHSPPRTRIQGDVLAGVLIAAMIAILVTGVIVYLVVRGPAAPPPTQPTQPGAAITQTEVTPHSPPPVPTENSGETEPATTPVATAPTEAPTSESGVQLPGLIRGTSGDPIEGATIRFGSFSSDPLGELSDLFGEALLADETETKHQPVEARSAADGYYEVFLPIPLPTSASADAEPIPSPVDLEVRVSHPRFVEQSREISALRGDQLRADFVLAPGAVIRGGVFVADTGLPATGMKVYASENEDEGLPFLALGASDGDGVLVRDDGSFEITGIAPGSYRVSVQSNNTRFVTPKEVHAKTVELTRDRLTAEVEFKVEVGGTLTGRVSDRAGNAIPGVRVRLRPSDWLQSAMRGDVSDLNANNAETNEHGEFQILGIAFGRKLRVVVDSDDHARPDPVRFELTLDQPERHVEIQLEVGSSISGFVVDANGDPVEEIEVRVLPDFEQLSTGFATSWTFGQEEAETDETGRFTLKHLRAGRHRITTNALGPDFRNEASENDGRTAFVEVDGVEHVTGVTLLYLPEEENPGPTGDGVVSGRVFDDLGDPISGAEIEVSCLSNPFPVTRHASSDGEGNFSITGLPGSITRVVVDADGHASAKLPVSGGATEGLEFVLLRNATISGRVIPPADELISSFRVTFRPYEDAATESTDLQATIDDMLGRFGKMPTWTSGESDGTFTLEDVPAGAVELIARAPGFAESLSAPITLQAGQEVTGVEIILVRGGSITGRVVNDGGQPLDGAIVSIRKVSGDATEEMLEKFMPAMLSEQKTVTTDDRGRFSFSRVSYAEYEVVAKHGDLAPSPGERVVVSEDREYPLRDLVVSAGGVISGTIVDENGEPKSGLMVQLLSPEIGMQMANADAEGKFQFASLSPGEYSVLILDLTAAQRGDTKIKTRHVEITGGETEELEIAYGKGFKLTGTIKGFDTVPFQQSIQVSRPGGPSSADINPMNVAEQMKLIKYLAGMALVKPDGTFVVEDLEPGTYIVEVPVVPGNPLDATAYDVDRTPLYRKEITIKERDTELDIRVNPR